MTNEKKPNLTIINVSIPRMAVIAESDKSILIEFTHHYQDCELWINKNHAKLNLNNKFCDVIQLTLFKEWKYKVALRGIDDEANKSEPLEMDGIDLSRTLAYYYREYNYSFYNPKLNK